MFEEVEEGDVLSGQESVITEAAARYADWAGFPATGRRRAQLEADIAADLEEYPDTDDKEVN